MRIGVLLISSAFLLAACGSSIQARCSAEHGSNGQAYAICVQKAENAVRARGPRPPTPNG